LAFFSSQVEEKEKKNIEKKKNAKKGRRLPFFFCFCICDEMLLLLSPFHIPSMLSSSPSSSLCVTFHGSFVLLKLRSSPELWRCEGNRRGEVGRRGGSR
jgi:hypothetical protein